MTVIMLIISHRRLYPSLWQNSGMIEDLMTHSLRITFSSVVCHLTAVSWLTKMLHTPDSLLNGRLPLRRLSVCYLLAVCHAIKPHRPHGPLPIGAEHVLLNRHSELCLIRFSDLPGWHEMGEGSQTHFADLARVINACASVSLLLHLRLLARSGWLRQRRRWWPRCSLLLWSVCLFAVASYLGEKVVGIVSLRRGNR